MNSLKDNRMNKLDKLLAEGTLPLFESAPHVVWRTLMTRDDVVVGVKPGAVVERYDVIVTPPSAALDEVVSKLLAPHRCHPDDSHWVEVPYRKVMILLGILGGADCVDGLSTKFGVPDSVVARIMAPEIERMKQKVLSDGAPGESVDNAAIKEELHDMIGRLAGKAAADTVVEAAEEFVEEGKHAVFVGLEEGMTLAFLFESDKLAAQFSELLESASEIKMFDGDEVATYERHNKRVTH